MDKPSEDIMKNLLYALISLLFLKTAVYTVTPPPTPETVISGKDWAYTVSFVVQNTSTIEKLIQCESQGVNIARPDSNGLMSWGILQFNGNATWIGAERRFGFSGSPMDPSDAIHMADLMISAGELKRWTCARILHL